MQTFDYKLSVVVPVYNGEKYISSCLDSLLNQGMADGDMEVLIINDGSTDSSRKIAENYCLFYKDFTLYNKENEGLSATRNYALDKAKGKYIAFLDVDDTLKSNSLRYIVDFFEKHDDEVDIVTYPIVRYKNDKALPLHYRYKYLKNTGVYSLDENPYISQANINIVVKNISPKIYFDTTPNFRHEDMRFNNDYVKGKGKIGFVKEAEYRYNRDNDDSIIASYMYSYYIFEASTSYWEELFGAFSEKVPEYYQAIFFNDLVWKFAEDRLWPYHYNAEQFKLAKKRIYKLLKKVDEKIILNFPNADIYQKLYWIRKKANSHPTAIFLSNKMQLMSGDKDIYHRNCVEIILKRILVKDKYVKIIAYYKSPLFSYTNNIKFWVKNNDSISKLDVCLASSSYHKSKELTDKFYAFQYEYLVNQDTCRISFYVEMDGVLYSTEYWNANGTPFYRGIMKRYATKGISISQDKADIVVEIISKEKENEIRSYNNTLFADKEEVNKDRKLFDVFKKKAQIWLYYDNYTVDYDNGFLQFMHDININDGIQRYYIASDNNNIVTSIAGNSYKDHIIRFGSSQHKSLYLNADKIFTSFIEHFSISPFSANSDAYISDIFNAEIIYLQHGVLHAHLPWFYTPIGVNVDKVVVSSKFEMNNFAENYGFKKKDIWSCGAPRYNEIKRNNEPEQRILFAPSWRSYLIGNPDSVEGRRKGDINKLANSNYLRNIMNFANDERLTELLTENDLYLDVKLHPNFYKIYHDNIIFTNPRISLCKNKVDITRYKAFITDFSSYVFDYAYLNRPIFYYVPDYDEFKSGMNRYRELDLPFEEAFGPLSISVDQIVENIDQCIKSDFMLQEPYIDRLKDFFIEMDNPCEKIYALAADI